MITIQQPTIGARQEHAPFQQFPVQLPTCQFFAPDVSNAHFFSLDLQPPASKHKAADFHFKPYDNHALPNVPNGVLPNAP